MAYETNNIYELTTFKNKFFLNFGLIQILYQLIQVFVKKIVFVINVLGFDIFKSCQNSLKFW